MFDPCGGREGDMSKFSQTELKWCEIGGYIATGLSLAIVGIAHLCHNPDGHYAEYTRALRGGAWIGFGAAVVWTVLAILHHRTHLFSLDRPVDAGVLGATIMVTVVLVVALHFLVIPRLPETPKDRLPADPKLREKIETQEGNFRLLVSVVILAAGGIVVAFPVRRFIKK